MTHWDLVRCSDEYYRRVVYGLGPYTYSRLRGAGSIGLHRSQLVCKVHVSSSGTVRSSFNELYLGAWLTRLIWMLGTCGNRGNTPIC